MIEGDHDASEKDMIPSTEVVPENGNVLRESPLDSYDELNFDSGADKNNETITLHDVNNLENVFASELENISTIQSNQFLPIRVACAAHTLNLVGKTDSYDALTDEGYADMYFSVIRKLNILWDTSTKGRKNPEIVAKYLKRQIIKPHRIRWNRIYDAVIIQLLPRKEILPLLQLRLDATCFGTWQVAQFSCRDKNSSIEN